MKVCVHKCTQEAGDELMAAESNSPRDIWLLLGSFKNRGTIRSTIFNFGNEAALPDNRESSVGHPACYLRERWWSQQLRLCVTDVEEATSGCNYEAILFLSFFVLWS